ncbi:MAG: PAS domain S-box protein [Candidatus Aminicenantia bacterium]
MKDENKTKEQLINELVKMRQRIAELETSETERLSAKQAGKRAEEALKKSEEKYRLISENTSDLIAVTTFTLNPTYTYISPSHKKLLGYESEYLIGRSGLELVHPDDKKRLLPLLRKYISAKAKKLIGKDSDVSETIEFRVRDKSGNWHYLQSTVNIIKNELLFISKDITERKRAEQALKESEKRYRSLVENANDAIYIITPEGFEYVNPAFEKLTGYKAKEACSKKFNFWNIIAPEDRELTKRREEARKRGEKIPSRYEFRIVAKDGKIKNVEVTTVEIGRKEEVKTMGIIRDITERKKIEEALRESEEMYKTLVKTSPDAVTVTDLEGHITYVSQRTLEVHGFKSAEELIGKSAFELIAPEDHEEAMINLQKTLEEGFMRNLGYTLLRKDGTCFIGELNTALIKDAYGKPKAFIATTRDITERKRAEEELKQSWEKLRRAMEETIRAMALTSEIRDPFTAGHQRRVSNLACAIAKEMGLPEKQIDGVRLTGIIHDIGKIYVPAEILSKPGRITEIEFSIIKNHTQVGHDILKTIEFPWPIAQIVLQHHEMLDGSGYPYGLSGEEIILEARILGVADVVEAMASHRPYRPAQGIDKALEEISQNRGVLYDPKVVDACLKLFTEKEFKLE